MRNDVGTGGFATCMGLVSITILFSLAFFTTAQVAHLEQGEYKNERKVDVSHGGRIAEPEVNERLIEYVYNRRDRGVHRATTIGQNRNFSEQTKNYQSPKPQRKRPKGTPSKKK